MVTNTTQVVCPKCGSVNHYEIIKSEYIDRELHTSYDCEMCGCRFINIYALVYLGGYAEDMMYDRDNITVAR